ncbi:MAG TPA: hypothetical protein VGM16_07215 [Gammaproteobacteria bacterium]|jgi:hypothetical protein
MRSPVLSQHSFRISRLAGASLFLFAGCAHEANQYLGANPRVAFTSSYLVDQTTMQFDESKPGVDWGLSLVWMGDHYLLTADQNTTPGKPTQDWQIVALQDIPLLRQGEMIALGTCRRAGVPISRVTAVVKYQGDQPWFDQIQSAWVYDYRSNAFKDYPTERLQCRNPRYGLGLDKPPASATAASPAAAIHAGPAPQHGG